MVKTISWDGLHTFVRIPAGAMLAAAAVGDMNPAVTEAQTGENISEGAGESDTREKD